jgi:hypothetical protein
MNRGYNRKEIGLSHSREIQLKLKDQVQQMLDGFQKEHVGSSFDKSYDFIRKKVQKYIEKLDPNVRHKSFASKFGSGKRPPSDQEVLVSTDEVPEFIRNLEQQNEEHSDFDF